MVPSIIRTFFTHVVMLSILGSVSASYDLYLKAAEVKHLLGLNADLYYVRDGKVNSYALSFVIMIPNHVSELHFTWQSQKSTPVSYSISISVSDPDVLNTPQLNISRRGVIPTKEEVFRVVLQCTGKINAEVEVFLNLNITSPVSNVTTLALKRKKICLKEDETNGTLMLDAVLGNSLPFYIGVGCASTILVLLTAVVIATYFRTHKNRPPEVTYGGSSPALSTSTHDHAFLRVDTPNNASTTGSYSSSYKRMVPVSSVIEVQVNEFKPRSIPEQLSEINIERRKVILHEKLQEGTFGQIYHGTVINDDLGAAPVTHVFVKVVTDHASQIQASLMMAEGMMMLGLNHKSILPLIGRCTESPHHSMLIYPYMNQGNLKKFLLKCKFANEAHCHTLLTQDLVAMAIQIVQGMLFLHKRKIVHRDIATRNCVIDDWFQVKITDNALSRDLFPNDYYCLGDNENRPVKWLALESLRRKEFSCASDVWAFGVTLWELMTLAQQPYSEIDPFEMDAFLRDGYRLAQPVNCPDELFSVMARCWERIPDERPTVAQLQTCLQDFYTALGRFI